MINKGVLSGTAAVSPFLILLGQKVKVKVFYLQVKAAGGTPLAKLNKGLLPTFRHHTKWWSRAYKQKIKFLIICLREGSNSCQSDHFWLRAECSTEWAVPDKMVYDGDLTAWRYFCAIRNITKLSGYLRLRLSGQAGFSCGLIREL